MPRKTIDISPCVPTLVDCGVVYFYKFNVNYFSYTRSNCGARLRERGTKAKKLFSQIQIFIYNLIMRKHESQ